MISFLSMKNLWTDLEVPHENFSNDFEFQNQVDFLHLSTFRSFTSCLESDPNAPVHYGAKDFYIGACVEFFKHRFRVVDVERCVLNFVEANASDYSPDVLQSLRDRFDVCQWSELRQTFIDLSLSRNTSAVIQTFHFSFIALSHENEWSSKIMWWRKRWAPQWSWVFSQKLLTNLRI